MVKKGGGALKGQGYIYVRIYEALREAIWEGRYKPGELLPSEEKLGQIYSASRTTVRKAVKLLARERYVSVQQGRGAVVMQLKPVYGHSKYCGVKNLRVSLRTPGPGMLADLGGYFETVPAEEYVAELLQVEPGRQVYKTRWIQLIDGAAYCFAESFYRPDILPRLERLQTRPSGRFYQTLKDRFGLQVTETRDTIEAALATPDVARQLGVPLGSPMLLICRVGSCSEGVFEYSRTYFRQDIFRLEILQSAQDIYASGNGGSVLIDGGS